MTRAMLWMVLLATLGAISHSYSTPGAKEKMSELTAKADAANAAVLEEFASQASKSAGSPSWKACPFHTMHSVSLDGFQAAIAKGSEPDRLPLAPGPVGSGGNAGAPRRRLPPGDDNNDTGPQDKLFSTPGVGHFFLAISTPPTPQGVGVLLVISRGGVGVRHALSQPQKEKKKTTRARRPRP